MAIGKKPERKPRVRSRVEKSEGNSREPDRFRIKGQSAEHRDSEPRVEGMARLLDSGETLISAQFSEVVPVGRFAGVTIGPFQIAWKSSAIDLNWMHDVDWDEDSPLTDEQQEQYNRALSAIRGTSHIIQSAIDSDREIVDKAVERFIREEIDEDKEEKTKRRQKR
jgi:hypothetical protein